MTDDHAALIERLRSQATRDGVSNAMADLCEETADALAALVAERDALRAMLDEAREALAIVHLAHPNKSVREACADLLRRILDRLERKGSGNG